MNTSQASLLYAGTELTAFRIITEGRARIMEVWSTSIRRWAKAMADNDASYIAHFESQGEAVVRHHVATGGYLPVIQHVAIQWLAQRDDDAKRLQDASHAEMASTASRAATAAERAATAAERAAAAAELQAVAAAEQARIAQKALITARVATAIAAVALIVSVIAAIHVIK